MYTQLMTAAHMVEYEQKDRPRNGVQVKLVQSEGNDEIISLQEQIAQLQVAI